MKNDLATNPLDKVRETTGWRGMIKVMRGIEAFLVFVTVALVFFGVLLRYIFEISLLWNEEVLIIAAMWMYFLGSIIATEEESHIRGDVIGGLFKKPRSRKIHVIVTSIFSSVTITIFAFWVWEYSVWLTQINMLTSYLRIPMATSQYAIGFGVFGMAFFFNFHLIRYIIMPSKRFALKTEEEELPGGGSENQEGGEVT